MAQRGLLGVWRLFRRIHRAELGDYRKTYRNKTIGLSYKVPAPISYKVPVNVPTNCPWINGSFHRAFHSRCGLLDLEETAQHRGAAIEQLHALLVHVEIGFPVHGRDLFEGRPEHALEVVHAVVAVSELLP